MLNGTQTSQEPCDHTSQRRIGAAIGGVTGAAIGAAIGSPGGAPGAAAGAAAGAVVGGIAGRAVAEGIDPDIEERYWQENYSKRPYVGIGDPYEQYGPAYRYGWEAYGRHVGREFDEVEHRLRLNWQRVRGRSYLKWNEAKMAARDAWDRVARRR